MALSGTIYGSTNNDSISCYIKWTATQSTKYNHSVVTATLYYTKSNSLATYGTLNCVIRINGVETTDSVYRTISAANSPVKAMSATVTVPHNADGTKNLTIAAGGYMSGTTLTSTSLSGKITLNQIPRQATLTAAPDFNDEGNPVITYSNPAGTAVGSLQACIADSNGSVIHVPYRDIDKSGSTYTFSLTDAERKALRLAYNTANTNTVKFYVKTVIGENIYYSSLAKTFSIVNAMPTLNPTAVDTDAAMKGFTGDANKVVRYYSDLQYAANAAALKEATIKSYKITCGSLTSTAASGTFSNVSTGTITFTVTDSRGNSTTKTLNKTLIPYVKLTCNMSVAAPTTDGKMTINASGNYYSGSIGTTANTLTVQYRYATNGGSYTSWAAMTAIVSENTYTATASLTGLNYKNSYTIQTRAVDKIATVEAAAKKVKTTPVFDWSSDDFQFNVPVTFNSGYNAHNVLLWQGAYYMTANQTAPLATPVSEQPHGIVLVFSNYDTTNGVANDYDWHCYFVPKYLVDIKGGTGHCFNMMSQSYGDIASKYLYISDTSIRGHDNNSKAATNNGISYTNAKYVMRYVFGV